MALVNNSQVLGSGSADLILNTRGKIYVRVGDRFYELDYKHSGDTNIVQNNTTVNPEQDLTPYVTKKYLKAALGEYITKRNWKDVMETKEALENAQLEGFTESITPITVSTMQMVVGTQNLQFDFIASLTDDTLVPAGLFINNSEQLVCPNAVIKHYTLFGPDSVKPDTKLTEYARWSIKDPEGNDYTILDLEIEDKPYYVYLKVPEYNLEDNPIGDDPKGTGIGQWVISTESFAMEQDPGYIYLLTAIVTGSNDGGRSIGYLNGFTEILPGQITAYVFKSPQGNSYLDLATNSFKLGNGDVASLAYNVDGTGKFYIGDATQSGGNYLMFDPVSGRLYLRGNLYVIDDTGETDGTFGPDWCGEWQQGRVYCKGNIVTYKDGGVIGSYRWISANCDQSLIAPNQDLNNWECIARGDTSIQTAGLYYADADDDFMALVTDALHRINFTSDQTWKTTITLYEGSKAINITNASVVRDHPGDTECEKAILVNPQIINGVCEVTLTAKAAAVLHDSHKIYIDVSGQGLDERPITRRFTYTVAAVQSAEPNTIYKLIPSANVIKVDKEGNYDISNISCKILKINADAPDLELPSLEGSDYMQYIIDDGSRTNYSYNTNISTSNIKKKIVFEFYHKGLNDTPVLFDRETIPVVNDGINPPNLTLTADSLVFSYESKEATTPSNTSILFTAIKQNIDDPTYCWQYKNPSLSEWNSISGYSSTSSNTYSLAYNSSLFGGNNQVAIRVGLSLDGNNSSNEIFDELTIFKVYGVKGNDGDPAITIGLTNPTHNFSGDETTSIAETDTIGVVYYKGNIVQTDYTIKVFNAAGNELAHNTVDSLTGITITHTSNYSYAGKNIKGFSVNLPSNIAKSTFTNIVKNGYNKLTIKLYVGDTNIGQTIYNWTIAYQGSKGENGDSGKTTRWTTWKANTWYGAGDTETTETVGSTIIKYHYLDFVSRTEANGKAHYYQCKETHTSSSTFDSSKWTEISYMPAIATGVALIGNTDAGWIIDEGEIKHTNGSALLNSQGDILLGKATDNTANFSVSGSDGSVKINGSLDILGTNAITMRDSNKNTRLIINGNILGLVPEEKAYTLPYRQVSNSWTNDQINRTINENFNIDLANITVEDNESEITIPRIDIYLKIRNEGITRGFIEFDITGYLAIDGHTDYDWEWSDKLESDFNSINNNVESFSERTLKLDKGDHTISLLLNCNIMCSDDFSSTDITYFSAEYHNGYTIYVKYPIKRTEIGPNGMRVMFSSSEYAELVKANDNTLAQFAFRVGNYGLRVTSSGLKKMTNGKDWVDL